MVVSTVIESTSHGPGDAAAETLANAFKALGDPTRLRILAVLADGTHCVCEIQDAVDVPGNLLSHHLRVLREAGLIDGVRRGRWIDYTLRASAIAALKDALPPDPSSLGVEPSRGAGACATSEARR